MSSVIEDIEANEQAYNALRVDLEARHPGQWVVLVGGRVIAIAPDREKALRQAGPVPEGAASRLVRPVGEELPPVVRKL